MKNLRPVTWRCASVVAAIFSIVLPVRGGDLRVERLESQGPDGAPFDTIEVQFSRAVQDGTFTIPDVTFTGPGGALVPVAVTKVTALRYVVDFGGQTGLASYSLGIGPEISDLADDPMDQDGDGTPGEASEDRFNARLMADNAVINDATHDGAALLFAIGSATVSGDRAFAHVESQRGATPAFAGASTLTFQSVRTDTASSLRIGGGATVNVAGAVTVAGNSELRLRAKDNTGAVGGEFIGTGVVLNAASVAVDAGSAITADGEGYVNTGPGYNGNGAAHGGRGAAGDSFSGQPAYGDGYNPTTLGSGGSVFNAGSLGGGAIKLNVTGALVLDGEISADGNAGGQVFAGASGGSIWATVGTLGGSGKFTADGTTGGGGGHPAAGGRVAVYYSTNSNFGGFLSSSVAGGGGVAQKGTLLFVDTSVADGAARISQRFEFPAQTARTFGSLLVDNGASVELGGASTLTVSGALTLAGNSTFRVRSKDNAGAVGGFFIGVGSTIHAGSCSIEAGSILTADGEGYVNTGPGYNGNGAAHGGRGAAGDSFSGQPAYGDGYNPTTLGSGGSVFNAGSLGGGAIKLNVTGALVLDGEISADGNAGGQVFAGASGGSIWATVGTLGGSGKFTADGTTGGGGGHPAAGGRVAVYYSTNSNFGGFLSSSVAAGGGVAQKGTLLFVDTSVPGGGYRVSQRMSLGSDGVASFGELTIDNGALFEMGGGAVLNVTGALNLTGNSILRVHSKDAEAQVGGQWIGRGGTINAGSLAVGAGSLITADGEGYVGSRGPGYNGSSAGGTHGGIGGTSSRTFYNGDAFAPVELGSGGNLFNNRFVAGGGAIRLVIAGTFALDGEVSADALGNSGAYDGAAGGSIWVTAGTLAGSGKFTADGCSGGDPNRPSGGGGRIAVYYEADGGFDGFLDSSVHAGPPNGTPNGAPAEPGTMFFAHSSPLGPDFRVSQRFFLPDDAAMAGRDLTVDDNGLFEIGGNATVIMSGGVSLTDGSEMRFFSKDTTAAIAGEFVGRGSRLYAGNLHVDATSKLDADQLGYSNLAGPGFGAGGSSHGGLGGNSETTKLYGDANAPLDPGSSVGGNVPAGGGGAIELVVAGALTNDGLITADAHTAIFFGLHASGGSGGSVFVRAGSVAGAGIISADGGDGTSAGSFAGGGGRVAVFSTTAPAFPLANITVNPGTTGNPAAQAGTRVLQQSNRRFVLLSPKSGFAHGVTTFDFAGLGFDPQTTRATVEVRRGGATFPVAKDVGVVGRVPWDSSVATDGTAEVRVVFRNLSNQVVGEGSAPLVINNAARWHGGGMSASESWAADKVHIVEEDVLVQSGATLTIEAGAVVKFLPGRRIVARHGGIVDASAATVQLPVVLTSIADDTAGGDTNLDAGATQGRPGDWFGVPLEGTGQFLTSSATETRFARFIRTGSISTQSWPARSLNIVRDDVTVQGGQTLTILPGAVVKFELGRKMVVNGTLAAPGTFAQPIAFTSIRDDARGGDANRDGNTTVPFPTDWRNIQINGSATFDHCFLGYAQGEGSVDGILRVNGSAQLSNCTVADAVFSGVIVYGTAALENTVVLRTDRAIDTQNGSTTLRNCVIHANRIGLFPHGGALTAINSMITGNTEAGVQFATSAAVLRYCNVFGNTANFLNHADPTGSDGNVSVDPRYRDAARDDFRLKFGSPVIDAADGADAPPTDRAGAPRYDDPRTANTGIPTGNGTFPDLGVFEFVEAANVPSNLDLAAGDVSGPAVALAGNIVTVRWKIRNTGSETVAGPWFDTVAIRAAGGALAPVFAGEFEVGNGVVLGPGQTFEASAPVRVPGGTVGKYEWQVVANSRGTVFEGANTANNVAISASSFDLDLPELVIGAPPVGASFAAVDQPLWFKVRPGTGSQLKVSADLDGAGITELYVSKGLLPSRELFEHKQIQFAAPDVSVTVPNTQPQIYYVLAYPASLSATPQAFSIMAESAGLGLEGLTLDRIGGTGRVTIGYKGSLLPSDGVYQLVGPGGEIITAVERTPTDGSQVFATFELDNLPPGSYTARLVAGSQTLELPNAVTVVSAAAEAGDKIAVNIVAPPTVRQGRSTSVTVELKNISTVDVYAPVLRLTVDGWGPRPREGTGVEFFAAQQPGTVTRIEIVEVPFLPPPQPQRVRKQFVVMPLNPEEPAGILPPGFTARIVLDGIPELGSDDIKLFVEDLAPGVTLDHAGSKAAYKPEGIPDGAWDLIYANFIAGLGASTDSANTSLARSANYLSSIGQRPRNMAEILGWELRKASDFGAIERRWTLGPMGYGSEPMENRLKVIDSPGDGISEEVRIIRAFGRDPRIFRRKLNATAFEGRPGDNATLTKPGPGAFELRDRHGSLLRYDTPGAEPDEVLLTYAEDPCGRRETYGYTDGRLTTVSNDLGQTRTYVYHTSGRILSTTDHVGNTTTFGYDPGFEHLLTMTAPQGQVTTFEYYQGEGAAREHAMKRIIQPGGATLNFEFDERGRPAKFSRGAGQTEPVVFTYNSDAAMTVTDAAGNASTFRRDAYGRFVSVKNPGTHEVRYSYDSLGNQVQTSMPAAHASVRTFWDLQHNISAIADPSGRASFLTYHPVFNTPETYTDRRSQVTRFTYDDAGGKPNLTRIDYPGGTFELFSHDSRSRVRTNRNARGQTTSWDYDAQDQLIRKTHPNGDYDEFFYDPQTRQNTSVVRHVGSSTETTTLEYDARRLLSKVTYPNGRWISYTHDAVGRRESMTTQDGFITRWEYDGNNRLKHVKQGNAVVVTFGYDEAGRMASRTLANGASTAYQYAPSGKLKKVSHLRPDQTTLAEYSYEYDATGLCRALVGPGGRTEYDYDINGQLEEVRLPGRTIRYAYDAEGNRTVVDDDGTETAYATNHLNEYTHVGGEELTYDEDGNLKTRTTSGVTTTYSYDAVNRLLGVSKPGETLAFEYDALGNISALTRNGVRTEFLVDPLAGGDVIGEYGAGGLVAHYLVGHGLNARVDAANEPAYYLFDGGGHTTHLIDSGSAVLNSYKYLPFGEAESAPVETVANAFRYGGQLGMLDAGAAVYARARFYSPDLGRFVSRDPSYTYGSNPYLYCDNQPVGNTDPHGADGGDSQAWLSAADNVNKAANATGDTVQAILQAEHNAQVSKNFVHASESFLAANNTRSAAGALQLQKQGEGYLKAAGTGGERLATAKTMNSTLNVAQAFIGAGNLIMGDGQKAGLSDRLKSTDPNERMSAQADSVLFVATTGLKFMLSEVPFSGEMVDLGVYVVDEGSKKAFNWWFTPEDQDPEDVFGHAAYWRFRKAKEFKVVTSFDPNDIAGPAGFGPEMWIDESGLMHFKIRFENLPTATAAAYKVAITLPLDPGLDPATFAFDAMEVAHAPIIPPPGLQSYASRTDVPTDPNPVKVIARLDKSTSTVTWLFESFDPRTGDLPEDPLAGFLPPNNADGDGEGFVTFTIRPRTGGPAPFVINAKASIVFDTNPPIETNIHFNTVETGRPDAFVLALPATTPFSPGGFLVQWTGTGSTSGFAHYNIFVSDNGAPFSLWQAQTDATSALYPGVVGHTYRFFAQGTDNVGQLQPPKTSADTQTTVVAGGPPTPAPPAANAYRGSISYADATHQIEGLIDLAVRANKAFKGTVAINGRQVGIKGAFNAQDRANVSLAGIAPGLELEFFTVVDGQKTFIYGVVTGSGLSAPFNAFASPWTKTNPCPAAGTYTLVLAPETTGSPADPLDGSGYLTLSIDKVGTVNLAGKSADGAAIKFKGRIDGEGYIPFYSAGKKPGSKILSGEISFPDWPALDTLEGLLDSYVAPSALTLVLQHATSVAGSALAIANPLFPLDGDGLITLDGGGLAAPVTASYTFDAAGQIRILGANPQQITLTLKTKTGVVTGSFLPAGASKPVPIEGILLQQQNSGAGYFRNVGQSGRLELTD